MKSEKLLTAMGNISDELIADAAITAGKKSNNPAWIKWGAMAACLCLIIGCLFLNRPWGTSGLTVIYKYGNQSASYVKTPLPGEHFCYSDVYDAREHYRGQEVHYLLGIDLFGNTELSADEKAAEYQRLEKAGYRLYESKYWDYSSNGKKEYHSVVVGLFTEKELSSFKASSRYGYVFYFVINGDGSHIQKYW